VIENNTMPCLYEAPLMLHSHGLDTAVSKKLGLKGQMEGLGAWEEMVERIHSLSRHVKIAIVGKYVGLHDSYLSVREALYHGGYENDAEVEVLWIDSEHLTEQNLEEQLRAADGILVPGGFGDRGIEGMILACGYARQHDIPYLGICLGMQVSVIEYARNVLGIADANSREFDPQGEHCVIDLMEEQVAVLRKGGTMRLGAYPCKVFPGTVLEQAYGAPEISERHRHRFEFNNTYRQQLEEAGLTVSGTSPDGTLVEAVEAAGSRFHVGVQFHPEFKSRPDKAHPLFRELVRHSLQK
jgi:CTP synthase